MHPFNKHPVVCFGEVLWDILPTGAVPGGAPMNVAYHLHKQNKKPALITRIGKDEKGKELHDIFTKQGVCTDYFQIDEVHETGKVYAHPNEQNEVTYNIVQPSAWDFIEYEEQLQTLVSSANYFVFGSLVCRSAVSKNTLFSLLEMAKYKVLDINLRAPHFEGHVLYELLQRSDVLKLNNTELDMINGWYGKENTIEDKMKFIIDKFNIPILVTTLGEAGAVLCVEGNFYREKGIRVNVADTVGSGDAFLAGLLSKMLDKKPHPEALRFANALGAYVATKKGACPDYEPGDAAALMSPAG
jgi:fructokinase